VKVVSTTGNPVFRDSKRVLERNEDVIRYPSDKLNTATILNVNGGNNLE
jgi:hypothetical protein